MVILKRGGEGEGREEVDRERRRVRKRGKCMVGGGGVI